ncbi:MAG: metalloregulator ArsR/SmtB family transcription factor [Endomicrobiaceae bacterium]|nr:metalloregulator ArsR/SmtB family transcription factor [Endomicrobiaceae bacterium]
MKIYDLAEIFKALSHPIRLKIVCNLLKKDSCNVNKIADGLNIPQPTVSQHLSILKNADVITGYRKGTQICYKVENKEVKKILESVKIDLA